MNTTAKITSVFISYEVTEIKKTMTFKLDGVEYTWRSLQGPKGIHDEFFTAGALMTSEHQEAVFQDLDMEALFESVQRECKHSFAMECRKCGDFR